MKLHSNIFLLFSAVVFALLNISNQNEEKIPKTNSPDTTSITISVVGDLMCHSPQYEYAKVALDSFDFTPAFNEIKKYFGSSDFVFGNLETVTAGKAKTYSGYPFFNSPKDYITSLKKIGFNFLFTSNNHCLDRGETGVVRTLEELKKNEINSTGTFASQNERDSITVLSANGISFAVVSYTYGTNGNLVPKGKHYLVNLISDSLVSSDIQKARSCNVDFVLVYFHFGEEYQREPNTYQKAVVQNAIDAGADVILASHPHVLQPIEFFKSKGKLDSGFVAYSLGNFISNQRWRYSDAGVILQFKIKMNRVSHDLKLENIAFVPTWVFKGKIDKKNQFVILPSSKSKNDFPFLSNQDYYKMNQSFQDSKQILQKYSPSLQIN
ncbi:MAG: CapA family protein [Ignavibacteriaceae bacterium]|jgi:poly-gamma-glutamate synthesis protein (capsule biosynthesis protein)